MKRIMLVLFSLALLLGVTWVPAYSADDNTTTTVAEEPVAEVAEEPVAEVVEEPVAEVVEEPAVYLTEQTPSSASDKVGVSPLGVPASSTSEMDFIKVSPCRIVDTRVAGGNLYPGQARYFQAKGTTGFATQGGSPSGCGIPDGASAVEFTFTAVDQLATGFVRVQPWWTVMLYDPRATLLNYSTALNASNSVIVPVCTGSSCSYDFMVRNYGATAGMIVDVTGYFAPELFAVIGAGGNFVRGSGVSYVSHPLGGVYNVGFDRNITRCAFTATRGETGFVGVTPPGFISVAGAFGTTNAVYVVTQNMGGTAVSENFHLKVDC